MKQTPAVTRSPEGQKIDRESVKTLAIAIGVREAARKLGLNEDTVCSWASRGKWFKIEPKPQPPSQAINVQALQAKPSTVLKEALQDDSKETRLSLSRSIRRGAKALESELPAIAVFTGADKVKSLVNAASVLHNWQETEKGSGVVSPLTVYSRQTVLNVTTSADHPTLGRAGEE